MKVVEIGTVTHERTEDIRKIYFRKMALQELLPIIDPNNETLYARVIEDLAESNIKMHEWWSQVSEENDWNYGPECAWNIDFRTGAVSITE